MKPLQGQLLIASSKLVDPNFFRSVILMVQHGEEGALGLILNRPLDTTVKAAWEQVSESTCNAEGYLNQGGPCEGPLMVLHGDPDASQLEILDGLYFTAERGAIERLVADGQHPVKLFVGYAGWAPGQLESELEEGSWLIGPAAAKHIFSPPEDLWKKLHRAVSLSTAFPGLDPKLIPEDPSLN